MDRPKRSNAGSKMDNLIKNATKDAFYDSLMQNWIKDEEAVESDQSVSAHSESSMSIDSECEKILSGHEDDENEEETENPRKRKKSSKKPSYMLPSSKQQKIQKSEGKTKQIKEFSPLSITRSIRNSTLTKRGLTAVNESNRKEPTKRISAPGPSLRRLTQEELLLEAKITEERNIRHLGILKDFILFRKSDTPTPNSESKTCGLSNQPAQYKDPLTGVPYSDVNCFKVIREVAATQSPVIREYLNSLEEYNAFFDKYR
ncbi:vacuolar protein sorting-associated protein 72 homolog [Octopus sinensis]|uniref:Vacuolar protein sorting-associated protein 72 homolog n=1 Tax=Octopus sinensis TaxID=2607531 RepID=A0A6P7U108_9MOLL|nr:vacuolar protein sorting-associated protein 72 homolog [Octopus sinensis]